MIHINRRLKAVEAMNYCEKRAIPYQVQWGFAMQYQIIVEPQHEEALTQHLERWERE